jgi:hypothetical protein
LSAGTVQRMQHPKDGMPFIEHRTRDLGAMFADAEWGWSTDSHEAYVFECYGRPELPSRQTLEVSAVHVDLLIAAGESCRIWPCTFGVEQERKRARVREERATTVLRSAPDAGLRVPPEVYARTSQRLGEHGE